MRRANARDLALLKAILEARTKREERAPARPVSRRPLVRRHTAALRHDRGMPISAEIAALYRRDLPKLAQQLDAFDDQQLWAVLPGVTNSAGNLLLHLNGNLREFIGRQIGGVAYQRDRPREFAARDVPRAELAGELASLPAVITGVLESLTDSRWDDSSRSRCSAPRSPTASSSSTSTATSTTTSARSTTCGGR